MRPGADVREPQVLQQLADAAFVIVNAEALADYALEIDPAPAHTPRNRAIRAGLDDLRQRLELRLGQAPRVAPATIVLQPLRPCALKRCTQSLTSAGPCRRPWPPPLGSSPPAPPRRQSRRLCFASLARAASRRSSTGVCVGLIAMSLRMAGVPPATDESRHHRRENPHRVSSAGRCYNSRHFTPRASPPRSF